MKQFLTGRRSWVAAAAVFLLLGVAAYFFGAMSEHAAREHDASAAQQKYAALNAQFRAAEARVLSEQSINGLLTSRVWISKAAVALDNRNFGVANDAVTQAVASLKKVDAMAAGVEAQSLKAVSEQASAMQISVAVNLAAQRNRLLKLASDIDNLVAKSGATVAAPTK